MQLRDYQSEAITRVFEYFASHPTGNPVIAMPTGTGKSLVIAGLAYKILTQWPGQRIMVATHVKELIQQNYNKMMGLWPFAPAGVYSAGLNSRDTTQSILFVGVQSAAPCWPMFGHIDLLLVDEAHLVSPDDKSNYQKLIQGLKTINPYLRVIGLTATAWRLGYGRITDPDKDGNKALFDDICFDITTLECFNRLIAEGYLSPLIPKPMQTELDVTGVRKTGGDYNGKQLQAAVTKSGVTRAALNEALQVAADRKHWLIFASGVEHAEEIAREMNLLGETCLAVHSKMGNEARDEAIRKFQRGEVRALVNNNILTTGFDSPWVDCIVCLRPTISSVLWVQMLGRGTRPYNGQVTPWAQFDSTPKQNCLVLDFAGNTRKLGPINDPVVPKQRGDGGGEAPVKLCEVCNTFNHASVRLCCCCGSEFQFAVKIKEEASTIDVIKQDMPKTKVFKVTMITAKKQTKVGRPPTLRITYHTGLKSYDEWVCFEHTGFARVQATRWWKERSKDPCPETVGEALELLDQLPSATHINVHLNPPDGYPKILSHCYDGTAFGEHAAEEGPGVMQAEVPSALTKEQQDALDDDIPF